LDESEERMRYVGNWLWCLRNLEGTPRKRTGSGRPRKARKVERGPTSNENATNPNENMKPNENMNMNSNENMNLDESMSPDGSMGEEGGSSGQGDDDQAERSSDQGQRYPSDPAPGQSIRQTARGMLEESDGKLELIYAPIHHNKQSKQPPKVGDPPLFSGKKEELPGI